MLSESEGARAADRLAARLAEAGCRFAFGIPGGETLTLMDALERAGIRYVLAKHETAAGFMAEATWHRTGAPGILAATVGPGLTNAVNAVANAALDRVPLLVLSGCVDPDDQLTYTHQILDHGRLLEPAVKGSFTLSAGAPDLIAERALALALDPRPGPVHIDIPIKVAAQRTPLERKLRRGPIGPSAPAEGADLERARAWLERAERPLLITGFDAVLEDAGAALQTFAERFRIPVIQTYKAKGLLPEDHPLALAPAALSPVADAVLKPVVKAADLLLLAGYDPIEMRLGWQDPWDPAVTPVVELTPVPNDHYMHQASLSFIAGTAAGLEALGRDLVGRSTWTETEVAECREQVRRPFRPDELWGPAALTAVARAVLPRETVATVDSGAHRILLSQIWPSLAPRTLLQSNGLCTMGCALPLAIGAKLAEPARPAAVFVGDGSLLMVAGELATAAELGLPIIVVVFDDRSLALIEKKQRESQLKKTGVDLGAIDWVALAQGFGGQGVVVESRDDLAAALRAALDASTFTLIACRLEPRAYDGRI